MCVRGWWMGVSEMGGQSTDLPTPTGWRPAPCEQRAKARSIAACRSLWVSTPAVSLLSCSSGTSVALPASPPSTACASRRRRRTAGSGRTRASHVGQPAGAPLGARRGLAGCQTLPHFARSIFHYDAAGNICALSKESQRARTCPCVPISIHCLSFM